MQISRSAGTVHGKENTMGPLYDEFFDRNHDGELDPNEMSEKMDFEDYINKRGIYEENDDEDEEEDDLEDDFDDDDDDLDDDDWDSDDEDDF